MAIFNFSFKDWFIRNGFQLSTGTIPNAEIQPRHTCTYKPGLLWFAKLKFSSINSNGLGNKWSEFFDKPGASARIFNFTDFWRKNKFCLVTKPVVFLKQVDCTQNSLHNAENGWLGYWRSATERLIKIWLHTQSPFPLLFYTSATII